MPRPSECGCEKDVLPEVLRSALAAEFPTTSKNKQAPRISPTAEQVAKHEWKQLCEWDLPFDSVEKMKEFVLQAVRVKMKELLSGE